MSKDILYAFQHYGVTPDSVKRAEKVLADNGIDKKNGERKPTSFRGGIASPLDKGKKNMIDYKQSGTGAASDLKQKGGEASCPKDESASRRKFSGKSTEAHELQPWVAHCELYPFPVCLQRAGIIPRDPDEKVVYAGHEMTYAQSEELSDLVREFWEWFDFHTDAFTLEEDYEKETGVSCVWWIADESLDEAKTTLPRPTEYETQGFTDEFVNWVDEKVIQAYFKGKKTVKSVINALKPKKGKK